ncbi:MAG: LytR/AlgR family response regulator transcription factor [Bacteroidota bacterium]
MITGLTIISLLTELVSWIARGKPAPLSFYIVDLFIISIWFFVINGIYVGLYYYDQLRIAQAERREEKRLLADGLVVKQGKQDIKLSFETLAGFYVDNEYAVACQLTGKKYYVDQSLDKLEVHLPASVFFRLNRQYILHRQMISGFRRSDNGKLLVFLNANGNFPSEITVSRTKASGFKEWFRPQGVVS